MASLLGGAAASCFGFAASYFFTSSFGAGAFYSEVYVPELDDSFAKFVAKSSPLLSKGFPYSNLSLIH